MVEQMSELHQAKAGARRGERRGAGSNKPANHLADEDQWSAGPGMGWAIWGGWWRSNSYAPGRGAATSRWLPGCRGNGDGGTVRMKGVHQAHSYSPCIPSPGTPGLVH